MVRATRANWYDYPQYYDLAFRDETKREIKFLEGAFERYSLIPVRTVLEPACGSGRLVAALACRGYHVIGLDLSHRALVYARQRLNRLRLAACLFRADMHHFALSRSVDAICCTFDSFRHLLTERDALAHLLRAGECLRPGGIYVLGLHLLPPDAADECIERWRIRHGKMQLSVTLRVVRVQRRLRREWLRINLLIRGPKNRRRIISEFPLRLYTATQLQDLLEKCGHFDHCATFDYWYELDHPCELNDRMSDTVLILRRCG